MTLEDDAWAYDRIRTHADIEECSSFRVELDGVVHRFVTAKSTAMGARAVERPEQRWHSLCGIHPKACPPSVDQPVDCIACLAEGG